MAQGYLSLVLHAHLPFVRHPEHPDFLEEDWLYEAITETYIPLLWVFEGLLRDGVDFRITMSLTPTLVSMFDDPLLRDRYLRHLERLIELAEKEVERTRHDREFCDTARMYLERLRLTRTLYVDRWQRDLVFAFRRLQDAGVVEIVTCAATHAYLPLLRLHPQVVRAQIRLAVEHYEKSFGRSPSGFWLPECGYYPGIDALLAESGLRYFFLESHGILRASTRAKYGVYAPICCPSGLAAFARDPESSKQVWSADEGYPGDPDYREFYRDVGFDLPLDYVRPYIGPNDLRIHTGIKYYRITGRTQHKEPYVRERAMEKAAEHAGNFLLWRGKQIEFHAARMDRKPIVVAPYDAELFGHWWFEGPEWINFLVRKIHHDQDAVRLVTPSEYLAEYPEAQAAVPSESSWGHKGYHEVWLNGGNDWIYRHIHRGAERMMALAARYAGASGLRRRALAQAARELLLAQASDWAFILKTRTSTGYAVRRTKEHLLRFDALEGQILSDELDERWISDVEERDNVFPEIRFEVFAESDRARAMEVKMPERVAFIAAEAVPYVKVGGLADVAGALPKELARLGWEVRVILPGYRSIDRSRHEARQILNHKAVSMDGRDVQFRILEVLSPARGVRVFLVDEDAYFTRDGIYVDPASGKDYPDGAERFIFFARAALEALRTFGEPIDVLHCHDHQASLIPAYLKLHHRGDATIGNAATLLTIHNIGYPGLYSPDSLRFTGFGPNVFYPLSPFEYYGMFNMLKVGIVYADKLNTVSATYAREIQMSEEFGLGLEGVLRDRSQDLVGIVNGIDTDVWNPATDRQIARTYDAERLEDKRENKRALLERARLDPARLDCPLVGMISRLVDQKGFDILADGLDRIMDLGVTLVILGTGLPKYHELLELASARFPGKLGVMLKFDNEMAHLIEAGADIFLMPSRYEPCGLNQMYSLRYGTVPVVRRTGGLADTVTDDDASGGQGTGFAFDAYESHALVDAVRRAVEAYRDRPRWERIMRTGMGLDLSWGASARSYVALYQEAMRARSG